MLTPIHVREVIKLKQEIDAQLIANNCTASVDVSNVHAGVREIVTEQYKSAGWWVEITNTTRNETYLRVREPRGQHD